MNERKGKGDRRPRGERGGRYPKVDFKVTRTAKLAVPHLKSHGHFVIFMEILMEAFARVCAQLDIVTLDLMSKQKSDDEDPSGDRGEDG